MRKSKRFHAAIFKSHPFLLVFTIILAGIPTYLSSQSKWERLLGGTETDAVEAVIETSDGMLLVAGSSESFHPDDRWAYLAKLDMNGNLIWQNTYNQGSFWNVLVDIIEISPGEGYLAVGRTWASPCGGETLIRRFTHDGDTVWTRCIPDNGRPTSIRSTNDGNFIITNTRSNGGTSYDFQITKIDEDGNLLWSNFYSEPNWDFSYNTIQTADSGYAIAGYAGIVTNGQTDAMVVKTDEAGNELWRTFIGGPEHEYGSDIIELDNQDLLVLGTNPEADTSETDIFLARLDKDGNLLWIKNYGDDDSFDFGHQLIATSDGNYAMLGYSALMNYSYERDIQLRKLDSNFDVVWKKTFGGQDEDGPSAFIETSDHGFCIVGETASFGDGMMDMYVIKTDSSGNSQRNIVTGVTYFDRNGSCVYDTLIDPLLNHIPIQFSGKDTLIRISNAQGYFSTLLDTGSYVINPVSINPYWGFCNFPQTVLFSNPVDTTRIDIPMKPEQLCPYLSIDITVPFVRRCFSNSIYVHYCNYGTAIASNPLIEVTLDSFYLVDSSSATLINQLGHVYTFQIPDIAIWECGNFIIYATLNCDAALGEDHCVAAHIYPDSLCHPDADSLFFSEECRNNIGSYDPNDKIGFPGGVGESHQITNDTEVKYQIRFQNTGTDTAFNVFVLDTLPASLDLSTYRAGSSSHSYELNILNPNILKWTFANIKLPDSTTNQAQSNGFVNFFISPKPSLPRGTIIENKAAIYFDFNTPVKTNSFIYTIGDLSTDQKEINTSQEEENAFTIIPNPASESCNIIIQDQNFEQGFCMVYNANGMLMSTLKYDQGRFMLSTKNYNDGFYAIKIINSSGSYRTLKLMVRKM